MKNNRIGRFFKDRKQNKALEEYLSVSAIAESSSLLIEDGENWMDVIEEKAPEFSEDLWLTIAVEDYEEEALEKFHSRDVYRTYSKDGRRATFGDLPLELNLSYVKYDLKNFNEALLMFEESSKVHTGPEVPGMLI